LRVIDDHVKANNRTTIRVSGHKKADRFALPKALFLLVVNVDGIRKCYEVPKIAHPLVRKEVSVSIAIEFTQPVSWKRLS